LFFGQHTHNILFFFCLDILENYGRSPFLGHEANNFLNSPGRDCKGVNFFVINFILPYCFGLLMPFLAHVEEDRRLDTISEGISYDDFGSD